MSFPNITSAIVLAMTLAACSSNSDNSAPAEDEDASSNTPDTLGIADAEMILTNVVSVINENAIEAFYQTAIDDQLFQGKYFFISNTSAEIQYVDGGALETPYPVEVRYGQGDFVDADQTGEYSCASGGSLVGYFAEAYRASDWVFDGCVIGSNTYSGTVGSRVIARGGVNRSPVYDLTIEDSNGQVRSLSGGYSYGNLSFVTVDSQSNWDSASYRGPADGGQLQIDDYSVSRTRRDDNNERFESTQSLPDGTVVEINEYSVSNAVTGDFAVSAPWTRNESLSVTVDLSFRDDAKVARDVDTGEAVQYSDSDPEDAPYWQSGSITVTAEDGSQLQATPVEGQNGSFLITTSNGETVGPVSVDVKL